MRRRKSPFQKIADNVRYEVKLSPNTVARGTRPRERKASLKSLKKVMGSQAGRNDTKCAENGRRKSMNQMRLSHTTSANSAA